MTTFKPKFLNFFKIYSAKLSTQQYLILFGILVICTSFVSSFYIIAKEYYEDGQRTELNVIFENIKQRTNDRLILHDQILKSLTLFFSNSTPMELKQWESYINILNIPLNFPTIRNIGFIQATQNPKLLPTYSILINTSLDSNTNISDIDLEKNLSMTDAMSSSRDEAHSVVSKKINSNSNANLCVMFYPVYNNNIVPSTVMERQQNIKGFVFSVIDFNQLFKRIIGSSKENIHFKIFDGIASPTSLLFETSNESGFNNINLEHSQVTEFMIFNHKFTLLAYFVPSTHANFIQLTLWGIIVIGAILTVLLYSLTWSLFNNRARALELFYAHGKLKIQYKTLEEITQTNIHLREADRLKSEFLANVSHELRTPLNSIIGFSEVLTDELPGKLNDHQKSLCQNILTSGQHLLVIINDILNLSKIESGTVTVQIEMLDLPKIINESVNLLFGKAKEKNIEMTLALDEKLNKVLLDPVKLKQIIVNLLSNAIKFTPIGGKVTVKTALVDSQCFDIEVCDTGIGIADSDLQRLFKPFQQLDSSLARLYEGTGLGLALVKKLTELQGGSVEVKSQPGKGSCFKLRFNTLPDVQNNSPNNSK